MQGKITYYYVPVVILYLIFITNDIIFINLNGSSNIYAADYFFRLLALISILGFSYLRESALAAIKRPRRISDLIFTPIVAAAVILLMGLILSAPLNRAFEETILFSYPKIELAWLYVFDLTVGLALVAVTEEITFRGVFPALLSRYTTNKVLITLITSVLFGLIHWSKGIGNMITAFIDGIIFMICYYRSRSIVPPAIAHYMVNFVIYF